MKYEKKFLHAGNETVLRVSSIVGIFDLDSSTIGEDTRHFLAQSEKNGKVKAVVDELPKAFVLTRDGEIIMTQIAATTLCGRIK